MGEGVGSFGRGSKEVSVPGKSEKLNQNKKVSAVHTYLCRLTRTNAQLQGPENVLASFSDQILHSTVYILSFQCFVQAQFPFYSHCKELGPRFRRPGKGVRAKETEQAERIK